MSVKEITLQRDCIATRIPAGDEVQLSAGSTFTVAQALGGSVTLRSPEGMYRLASDQFTALEPAIAERLKASAEPEGAAEATAFGEEQIWNALKGCYDPEIPVNIVDLGLIYDLQFNEVDDGLYDVSIKMTLTAPGCGMGPTIANDAKSKVESLPSVRSAQVDIVWDPQWTPHMISEEGRQVMGLD